MPVVVEIEESVVDIVMTASALVVEEQVAGKAFVAGHWEVVGNNLTGRVDSSVVEIADRAASHLLATVAGNEHVNQVAVSLNHTVELGAATESKVVHRLAAVAFVVSVGAATAEAAFLEVAAVVAALVAAASVEAHLVSTLVAAVVDAIDAAAAAVAFAVQAMAAAASVEGGSTAVASAGAALPLQAFDTAVARVISATRLESVVEP